MFQHEVILEMSLPGAISLFTLQLNHHTKSTSLLQQLQRCESDVAPIRCTQHWLIAESLAPSMRQITNL
jgi:hypothetical protein